MTVVHLQFADEQQSEFFVDKLLYAARGENPIVGWEPVGHPDDYFSDSRPDDEPPRDLPVRGPHEQYLTHPLIDVARAVEMTGYVNLWPDPTGTGLNFRTLANEELLLQAAEDHGIRWTVV